MIVSKADHNSMETANASSCVIFSLQNIHILEFNYIPYDFYAYRTGI
jgi:hypothetical protein